MGFLALWNAERLKLALAGDDADHVPLAPLRLEDEVEADGIMQPTLFNRRTVDEQRYPDVLQDRTGGP